MKRGFCLLLMAIMVIGCGSPKKVEKKYQGKIEKNSQMYVSKAMQAMANKDVSSAIKFLDMGIKANPAQPEAYLALSQIYLKAQNYTRSIDTASALLKFQPTNGEALFLIASGYASRNSEKRDSELALLAAKKSAEVFMVQKNKEKFARSLALVKQLQIK